MAGHRLRPEQRVYFWLAWRGAQLAALDAALAAQPLPPPPRAPNGGDAARADPMRRSLTRAASVGRRPSFESGPERAGYTLAHLPTRVAKVADTLALDEPPWLRSAVIEALAARGVGGSGAARGEADGGAEGVDGGAEGGVEGGAGGAAANPATAPYSAAPTPLHEYDAVSLGCGPGYELAALALLQPLLALPALDPQHRRGARRATPPCGAPVSAFGALRRSGVRLLALDYEPRWEVLAYIYIYLYIYIYIYIYI